MSLCWMGTRAWEAQCLLPWLPFERGITLEAPSTPFPGGYSLESKIGGRERWGSGDSERLLRLAASFVTDGPAPNPAVVVSYSPVPVTSLLAGKCLWTVPGRLTSMWNDKIRGSIWLRRKGLPTVQSIYFQRGRFPAYAKMMVMQERHGSCGVTTYIGDSMALETMHQSLGAPPVRLSPCLDGLTINGHVFIFPNGEISVGYPSVQLISPVITGKVCRPVYAGNDFAAYEELVIRKARRKILQLLNRLGTLAACAGYVGVLGADLIYTPTDSSVYFLEINPRMQGSTGLLSILEASTGMIPSAARLFHALLGGKPARSYLPESLPMDQEAPNSQFLLRAGVHAEFPQAREDSQLVDEAPNHRVEFGAVTHRYLTRFAEPTFHHATSHALFRRAARNTDEGFSNEEVQ